MFEDFEVIHKYTRLQALEDGVLVDVSELAKEAGFKYPVAMTQAAWGQCVALPDGETCQDETGRLWDVLWCLRMAIRRAQGSELRFKLLVDNGKQGKAIHTLKSVCSPGDEMEPVITIMLPYED